MAALDLGDVAEFPFVDPPDRRAVADGLALLSAEFDKRLGRLTAGQQKELKSLLERIV